MDGRDAADVYARQARRLAAGRPRRAARLHAHLRIENDADDINPLFSVDQWEPYDTDNDDISTIQALRAIDSYLEKTRQAALHGETQILIKPGFRFRLIDGMITNFHQPRSTLLLLVSAFVNGDWKRIYDYALSHNFRFLSYGDSSLLLKE